MKQIHTKSILAVALALATASSIYAQTYVTADPTAVVRNGTYQDTDIVEPPPGSTTVGGTSVVSLKNDGSNNTRKYYTKIALTGNPNTNGPIYISYQLSSGTPQRQDVQIWSLDQAYSGFSSNLTWNTAQANDTNSLSMLLTDPTNTFTATAYDHFLSGNGGASYVHELNGGPWGHMIRSGNVIYLVMSSLQSIGGNGMRFVEDSVQMGYEELTTGAPPSLGLITNSLAANGELSVIQGFYSTATNFFTVADPETAVASLTVTNSTSNEAALSTTNVFVVGTGATRSVYVNANPTATPGTNRVLLSLVDGDGNRATRSFNVVVKQFNLPPEIIVGGLTNSFPWTNVLINTPVSIPFAVSDPESTNSALTVTASVAGYSAGVLASATLTGTGPNTNLSITVTPQTGVDGVGTVIISCNDTDGNTNTLGFCVMVQPSADVVFVDHFDYQANNSKLTDDAPGFWTRRNGTPQSVFLRTATSVIDSVSKVAWVRPNSGAESLAAPLAGGVYDPTNRAVLYTKFTATFAELALGNVITNLNGDNPFFRMSAAADLTTDFVSLIALNEQSASDFTFWHANGVPTGPFATWPANFAKPSGVGSLTKTIVTRYDLNTSKSTLWIDGTSESDPSITSADAQDLTPVGYVGLFQNRGYGDIYIDDMTVTLKIKPLVTAVAPASGGNVDIYFNAGATDTIADFAVERAPVVTGAFSPVASTITSLGGGDFRATVARPGSEGYFKIKRTSVTF
jgi:hypothetical protein